MAFLQDVSPYLFQAEWHEVTSIFNHFLHCLLVYACFRTLSMLSHPFSQFLIKFRLCAGFTFLSTMALRQGIIKLFPVELVLGIGYFHWWIVKTTVQDMIHYGLVPRTRTENRVLAHTARLRKLHRHYVPGMHKVVSIGLFIIFTLVQGFTVKWGSSHCHPYQPRGPPMRDGRQRLFHHRRMQARASLKQYYAALSPSSTGWESLPSQHFPIGQRLQVEAMLLGHAFDHLALHFPSWDYHHMPPDLSFTRSSFANSTSWPLLHPNFPNIGDLFGTQAPIEPKTYSTTCHLQRRVAHDFSICFDTGCTMSSTFSLDDFEEPPVKGWFGQLRTINHVVPIKAAGIIRWHVLDSKGQPAIIHVPGYFIPSSGQRLLSPQSYAAYHRWADITKDCYGGNDKQFWMQLAPTTEGVDCQLLNVTISALDGLPYIQGHAPSHSQPCSSCAMDRPCAKCSHAFNLSVLSPHNENLTAAQKALLLDHQRLGHIGIDHLRTLYHCPTTPVAPTSIVEADCTACIVPRHPQVLTCSPLVCLACNVAKARKLPRSTGCSSHAELGEQHTLSQNIL